MADPSITLAESTANPVTSPENLAGKVINQKLVVQFFSVLALGFFVLYAYKTWLEVKVAKQELKINQDYIDNPEDEGA